MPEIAIDIAGRSYRLACDPGEEAHLTAAARLLDAEARGLMKSTGVLTEGRILLMAGLMLADRINGAEARIRTAEEAAARADQRSRDVEARLRDLEARPRPPAAAAPAQPALFLDPAAEAAIAALERTAVRLEALAEELEGGA
jgi:cell division protein ZapA